MCNNDFGEDGKSGNEHVTFSIFANYINKKGVINNLTITTQ